MCFCAVLSTSASTEQEPVDPCTLAPCRCRFVVVAHCLFFCLQRVVHSLVTGDKQYKFEEILPIYKTISNETDTGTFADFMEGFKTFDREGQGYMSAAELRNVITMMGMFGSISPKTTTRTTTTTTTEFQRILDFPLLCSVPSSRYLPLVSPAPDFPGPCLEVPAHCPLKKPSLFSALKARAMLEISTTVSHVVLS